MVDYDFSVFATGDAWVSLLTLTFLEIVLGVDNIIFISIVASRLPKEQQARARRLGLGVAMFSRIALLMVIGWIISLTQPLLTLPLETFFRSAGIEKAAEAAQVSIRDLILIGGGFFLIAKSVTEIHGKVEAKEHQRKTKVYSSFFSVLFQILLIDIVFSFDSILTAVGLTEHIPVMIVAVIIAVLVMMFFSGWLSDVINRLPTLQILALSFLIMIGLTLILEGFDMHVNKAFVYVAVLFSLGVELINIRFRRLADKA
jgi:predicted tellurium resistance membrane protein TerC